MLLWLLVRLVLATLGLLLFGAPGVMLPLIAAAAVSGVVAFLVHHDARVSRESLFHANLGTSRLLVAAIAVVVALGLEITALIAGAAAAGLGGAP
jgi:hypothetical protein